MRSRYSAFAVGDAAYLGRTWHPSTRPAPLELDTSREWTRLVVLATADGGPFAQTGTVDFDAHYREAGRRGVQHGRSTFARVDRAWVYVDEY